MDPLLMDWLIFLFFLSLICAVGFYAGMLFQQTRKVKPAPAPKPICEGCNHHLSFHKDGARCHAQMDDTITYGVKCGCRSYIGPERLSPDYLPSAE